MLRLAALFLPVIVMAQDPAVYRIDGGVSAPTVRSKVEPEYSEEARRTKVQGSTILSLVVDSTGKVRDIRVIHALGSGLDQKAIEAVAQWRFVPGTKDGKPVNVQAQIEVTFRLLSDPANLDGGMSVALWPSVPGKPEVVVDRGKDGVRDRAVSSIHNPSIEVFLPPEDRRTGASVIIAPGGGHRYLAIDHEGYAVARWLTSIGVAAMVLKYRLAREEGSSYTVDQAAEDGRRAIRVVRNMAATWHLDPARVGIMGFSAGGEVAALTAASYQPGNDRAVDPPDHFSSRPDFQVLMYPGIAQTSLPVDANTPPTFISFASNDNPGICESSAQLYIALRKAGVPVEMHVFARGGHGFGIKTTNHSLTATWTARLADWMADSGWLKKQTIN